MDISYISSILGLRTSEARSQLRHGLEEILEKNGLRERDPANQGDKPYRIYWFFHKKKYPLVNSHNYGKSPCSMGKSTISMGHLYHGYVSHNQRVDQNTGTCFVRSAISMARWRDLPLGSAGLRSAIFWDTSRLKLRGIYPRAIQPRHGKWLIFR